MKRPALRKAMSVLVAPAAGAVAAARTMKSSAVVPPTASTRKLVAAVRHAVANEPFQIGPQLEFSDVVELVPIGIDDRNALLQSDVTAELERIEGARCDEGHGAKPFSISDGG